LVDFILEEEKFYLKAFFIPHKPYQNIKGILNFGCIWTTVEFKETMVLKKLLDLVLSLSLKRTFSVIIVSVHY